MVWIKLIALTLGSAMIGAGVGTALWIGIPTVSVLGTVQGATASIGGDPILVRLILGSYTFTGLAFAWAWVLFTRLENRLSNHVSHDLDVLRSRLAELEEQLGHRAEQE